MWVFEATEPSLTLRTANDSRCEYKCQEHEQPGPTLTRRCYVQLHGYCSTMMSPLVLRPCKVS
jgi:hypothetical protein